ncbi:polysaccharide biosynthesis protein GumE [Sphingomonas oleivorans]|uniref:Polysaccharide biosynthesis protein GumE n=1 Tax=Sphingomonas oleivorans TaxID=1735121 RepID=A0A2T5G065_9SPHN|nr:polysaccharide biosynthesis protein GumE [Sphingomonas oleivorans]PTQ12352.1 polysaccharide biosynthesis protein GumE [Sphingomonas oleivorans]
MVLRTPERHFPPEAAPARNAPAGTSIAGGIILIAATSFNAALALINGHVTPVSYLGVALVQTMLTVASLAIVLIVRPPGVTRWLVGLWAAACGFLLLSLLRGLVEFKYLADILIILIFVMLGMAIRSKTLAWVLLILQAILVAVALWELLFPQNFGDTFLVRSYYVNSRSFFDEGFWSAQENLYLSAERPSGRMIGAATGFHRASSLFLEPVSLGNWTIVVTLGIAALQSTLSRTMIVLLAIGNILLLFACDGRLALAINLLLLAAWPILPRLPRWLPPLFLPLIFLALLLASATGLLAEQGDTLIGRFRYGLDYLLGLNARDLLGLYARGGVVAADSGWAYFILTQSIFGFAAIWLALTLHSAPGTAGERRFIAGMAIFVALSLPVSYSIFSIKTAALLWALYGNLLSRGISERMAGQPAGTPNVRPIMPSRLGNTKTNPA